MSLVSNQMSVSVSTPSFDRMQDLDSIAELVHRYNQAHAHLNDVELALHDSNDRNVRATLMHNLENARCDYMDARFALARTGNA